MARPKGHLQLTADANRGYQAMLALDKTGNSPKFVIHAVSTVLCTALGKKIGMRVFHELRRMGAFRLGKRDGHSRICTVFRKEVEIVSSPVLKPRKPPIRRVVKAKPTKKVTAKRVPPAPSEPKPRDRRPFKVVRVDVPPAPGLASLMAYFLRKADVINELSGRVNQLNKLGWEVDTTDGKVTFSPIKK